VEIAGDRWAAGRGGRYLRRCARGIGVDVHDIPVYIQPYYYWAMGFAEGDYPEAERYYHREATSPPQYPGLAESEQGRVVTALWETLT